MKEFIIVTPVDGAVVLHPETFQKIPAEGKRVRAAAYWERMKKQSVISITVTINIVTEEETITIVNNPVDNPPPALPVTYPPVDVEQDASPVEEPVVEEPAVSEPVIEEPAVEAPIEEPVMPGETFPDPLETEVPGEPLPEETPVLADPEPVVEPVTEQPVSEVIETMPEVNDSPVAEPVETPVSDPIEMPVDETPIETAPVIEEPAPVIDPVEAIPEAPISNESGTDAPSGEIAPVDPIEVGPETSFETGSEAPVPATPVGEIEEIEPGVFVVNNSDGSATPVTEDGTPIEHELDPVTGEWVEAPTAQPETDPLVLENTMPSENSAPIVNTEVTEEPEAETIEAKPSKPKKGAKK